MSQDAREAVKPHGRENPPKPAGKRGTPRHVGEFVLSRPARAGEFPQAMAKRPVGKE